MSRELKMADLRATPTEYKGVLYRSKCEAMFARYLDVWYPGNRKSYFSYEPLTGIDGFNPDFVFAWVAFSKYEVCPLLNKKKTTEQLAPILLLNYIEYKPTRPTDTYIQGFVNNVSQWHDSIDDENLFQRTDFFIYYGNPYSWKDIKNGILYITIDYQVMEWGEWLTDDIVSDLMSYRFDLKGR